MRIALRTETPRFFADIADVLRVFLGDVFIAPDCEEADATLVHRHTQLNREWIDACVWTEGGRSLYCGSRDGAGPGEATVRAGGPGRFF